jgi:hypothetical protein
MSPWRHWPIGFVAAPSSFWRYVPTVLVNWLVRSE